MEVGLQLERMAVKAHGSEKLGTGEREMEAHVAAGCRASAATGSGSSQDRINHAYSVKEISRDMATSTHSWTHVRRQARCLECITRHAGVYAYQKSVSCLVLAGQGNGAFVTPELTPRAQNRTI